MYVHPNYRNQRLGSGVLDALLTQATVTFQARTVRLDTCRFMQSAQLLTDLAVSRSAAIRAPKFRSTSGVLDVLREAIGASGQVN